MKSGDAIVTPNQPWKQNGSAVVQPLDPLQYPAKTLPLENRAVGTYTITQMQYTDGLVIINKSNPPKPNVQSVTLPVFATAASAIVVDQDYFNLHPNGFIIWFIYF